MPKNSDRNAYLLAFLTVPVVLARLLRPEPITHHEVIIVLVVLFILFGHRLPSLMGHLGKGPPGGFC